MTLVLCDELETVAGRVVPSSRPDDAVPSILQAIDGLASADPGSGVWWIWMTSRSPRGISPAVTRPGRLSIQIECGYADQTQKVQLLRFALRGVRLADDVERSISRLCRRMAESATAATVIEVARDAIARAFAREGSNAVVTAGDIRDAIDHGFAISDRVRDVDLLRTGCHEAGHRDLRPVVVIGCFLRGSALNTKPAALLAATLHRDRPAMHTFSTISNACAILQPMAR